MGMKERVYLLAGVLGVVVGVMTVIPAYAKENYILASIAVLIGLFGLALMGMVFGEENESLKRLLSD